MIAEFLFSWLSSESTITRFVGAPASRISETSASKGATKARIVYHLISSVPGRALTERDGKRVSRYQFDCYGTSPLEANNLANALESLVDPPNGPGSLYPKTIGGDTVYHAFVADRRGSSDVDAANPTPACCQQIDIMFTHSWP